jgi:small GTP-binding protein
VGKTSLISRFLTKGFDPNIGQSMGVDIRAKTMDIKNLKVNLQIWDFVGQIEFRNVLLNYARGAGGGIFVYDITNSSSMENINQWLWLFKEKLAEWKKIPIIVAGNKSDLSAEREVSSEDVFKISEDHVIHKFLECSAKSGFNVEKLFSNLCIEIMRRSNFT